jgi:glycosyltransferase involved in cell wall biosynthesis
MDGFDEHFEPAYCEDSDLAFRLRREGFRVLYQPRSVVVHHEGVTHGTDLTSGVKAYQVVNQARFKERWSSVLQAEQYPNGEHVLRARDRSKRGRVMLMIDHYVPEPDRDAGSRTIMELIKSLHAEGWVIKFWPENLRYSPVYTPLLQQMGVEVMYEPWTFSFNDWISKNGDEIDLIFLSRPGVAQNFLRALRKFIPDTPIIFYGHDLHAQRIRMQSRLNNDPRLATEADAMEVIERRVWRKVDLVLYPSKEEVDVIKQLEPDVEARVLLPFCYDVFKPLRSPPAVPILLFVAGFAHSPNIDAALWLCHEIMPLVRREVPLVTLWIVGSNPAYAVTQLANDFTKVTGYVTEYELELRYAQARVAIAPLRIGAGLKLKVVEAMQQGLPLVTTSVGAQGLEKLGEAAKVADEAEELAMELIQLLRDDDAWTEQARRQLEYVQQHFSRQASVKAIADATSAAISNAEKRKRSRPSVVSASPWLWMKRLTKSGR